jgi:hypothetical protein
MWVVVRAATTNIGTLMIIEANVYHSSIAVVEATSTALKVSKLVLTSVGSLLYPRSFVSEHMEA